VNARNKAGSTPLHKAMLNGSKHGIVEFLLQNKAEWMKNESGFTPFAYARDILRDNKQLFYLVLSKETNKFAKETIKIPSSALPIIIGKQGKMLETLRAQTQTDVEVPSKSKSPIESLPEEIEVHLTARCQEDIEVAKKRIEELIKKQEEESHKEKTEELFKQKKEVKKKTDQPQISDPKDKNYMRNIVTPILNNPAEKPQQVQLLQRKVRIPKDKHGLIIGKKGANIENIKKTYGVSINIPAENDPNEIIILQGSSKEKLDDAKFEILKFIQGGRGGGGGRGRGGGGGRGRMGGSGGYRYSRDPQPEEPPKPSKPVPKLPQKINLNDANEWPSF
jgi:predicted RNA-binding protein YlqC (UPF0109 family)